jgi:sugar phosphate isomerase/epimerase
MKLAICNEVWRNEAIEIVFQKAAKIGYDGVEIAPFTLAESVEMISAERRKEIARAAADAGVQIVGLHWLFVSPKGLHLTTPDDAVRARTAEYLRALIDFCADLGGGVMTLGSPQQRSIVPPNTRADALKRAREVLASVADTAAARNVTVCFEALSPKETNFINTIEQAVALVDGIGHPHIQIMLDVKAMASMPDGVEATVRKYGARAKHFHANEPNGKGPGMASPSLDFYTVLAALFETGYDGWVSVEPFDYTPDPDTVAQAACRTLREAATPPPAL